MILNLLLEDEVGRCVSDLVDMLNAYAKERDQEIEQLEEEIQDLEGQLSDREETVLELEEEIERLKGETE